MLIMKFSNVNSCGEKVSIATWPRLVAMNSSDWILLVSHEGKAKKRKKQRGFGGEKDFGFSLSSDGVRRRRVAGSCEGVREREDGKDVPVYRFHDRRRTRGRHWGGGQTRLQLQGFPLVHEETPQWMQIHRLRLSHPLAEVRTRPQIELFHRQTRPHFVVSWHGAGAPENAVRVDV